MGGRVKIRGIDSVINNLHKLAANEVARLRQASEYAADVLHKEVVDMASLTDHSLADLRRLGHPYSTRFGEDSGPHPDEMVHIQSGLLVSNVEKVVKLTGNHLVVAAGLDSRRVPYIKWIINGTSKMRPRDFLGHAWQNVGPQVIRIIKYGFRVQGSRAGKVSR